jgi:hypothetical protein
MSELRKFYIKWLTSVALFLALGAQFVAATVIPWIGQVYSPNHWSVTALTFLVSRPVLFALIAAAEFIIRKKLWRWLHPEFDFCGMWDGVSTYTNVHVGPGPTPSPVKHDARIEQDCLSIRLIPAKADRFVRFESTAANLIEAHKLVYSYNVVYKGDDAFPIETYGYEEMSPVEHDSKGRPQVLNGWFAHCVRPEQKAAYSGTVVFTRHK